MSVGAVPSGTRPARPLRSQLVRVLVATALVSVLIVGGLNFLAARALLRNGAEDRLAAIAESRVHSIEVGVNALLGRLAATGADLAVVGATRDFTAAFEGLDDADTGDGTLAGLALDGADLVAYYEERVVAPLVELGIAVTVDDLVPASDAGRALQLREVVGSDAVEAVDTSTFASYAAVEERFDDFFDAIVSQSVIDDVLLISPDGDVVYSVEGRIDVGTNLESGPFADTELADAVIRRLPRVRAGEAVLADFELYLPAGGRPSLFVVSTVKDGTEVAGAIAFRIAGEALDVITTADGDWDRVGLATGETYLVGPDRLLVSQSRRWIEDPEGYLDATSDERLRELIVALGSPVGLQRVDTRAVDEAADGEIFFGASDNYQGRSMFSYARQITVGGLDWIVVAEQPESEVRRPLFSYAARLGIALAVVLPVAALIGLALARRLTRSIPPVVELASAIAAGEREFAVPDLGANEFGDLARRMEQMAAELHRREIALEDEFEQRRALLLSVLPPRLVRGAGEIAGTGETMETATVVAIGIDVDPHGDGADGGDVSAVLRDVAREIDALAGASGVERVRGAADRILLVAGIGRPDDGAADALRFALDVVAAARDLSDDDTELVRVRLGVSSGPVATGVLELGHLTFAVWGEPVRRAMAIGALATHDEVLVDESTRWSVEGGFSFDPATDVIDLDGAPMSLFTPSATMVP